MSTYASMASVNQPRYLPNGTQVANAMPGAPPLLPNQGRIVQAGPTRILCVADVRGDLRSLNELAKTARADAIIHTGDFGFYDDESLNTIAEKTLKHVAQYSPLIADETRTQISRMPANEPIKGRIPAAQLPLSQLPYFLNRTFSFEIPIYTVWGACEDVRVLEKFRSGEYQINNFHIVDESQSRLLEVGGIKLRLLGLGGAIVMHKLFDNGEGKSSIAGGQGTMWTTFLQIGELVSTANQSYDPSETRVLVTHASPAREGLLNQLAVYLKVDFSISAGLHFRYSSSYNEFSVNPTMEHYRGKLAASQASFNDVWETVKSEVEPAVADNEAQRKLLQLALDVIKKMPSVASNGNPFGGPGGPGSGSVDEVAFKNMWNFNLSDAAYGYLVLEIEGGRIGTETRAQGFNFAHRGTRQPIQTDTKPAGQPIASPGIGGPPPYAAAQPAAQPLAAHGRSSVPAPTGSASQSTRPPHQTRSPSGAQGGPTRSAQQGPTLATQQFQATKTSPTAGAGSTTSPAAQTTHQDVKTASTPAAKNGVANGVGDSTSPSSAKPNGAVSPAPNTDATPTKAGQPAGEPGVFVQNVHSEEEARNTLPEADRAKIQRVQKTSSGAAFRIYFSSVEEATTILNALPAELKNPTVRSKPKVSALRGPQTSRFASGARVVSTGQRGYQSGASDSEGAARGGRGGFRGGRGATGGDRGRGGRGGRGGVRPTGGDGTPAAAATSTTSPPPVAAASSPAPAS